MNSRTGYATDYPDVRMKKVLFTIGLPLVLLACSTKNDAPLPDAATVI